MNPWFRCLHCGRLAVLDAQDVAIGADSSVSHTIWQCTECGDCDLWTTHPLDVVGRLITCY